MKLHGPFEFGASIPTRFTCEGSDVSPRLTWTDVPVTAQSLALICDDPDAPSPQRPAKNPWVHWVIFDVPAQLHELPEGISRVAHPAEVTGATQGINSWSSDNLGYRGPAPPPGSGPHHYYFKLYALDTKLGKHADGADKSVLLSNIKGHVLAEAELMGTYERKA